MNRRTSIHRSARRPRPGRLVRSGHACDVAVIRVLPVESWTFESFECTVNKAEVVYLPLTRRVAAGVRDVCL